ncbi:hypothetical protein MJO28_008152 [Puccinia striiformis f. sp. tritici]|uniref:Uncharacterized protein n=1 Tax=Puccinia striiformis f. sp. tritici TaxID=168172 RepID=A0ACC0EBC0_9BASI|nr:hypothetical protein MJO28_008152 [Puccinia striiformis f. sp. tritici]KAI7952426.1 hypothetical protein MJO29_008057 [Puccinia striiformis f. sp. tritici]
MSSALSEIQHHQPQSTKQKWWKVPLFNHKHHHKTTAAAAYHQQQQQQQPSRVFGTKLEDSLQTASVAISMIGSDQKAYIYGFIPVVVAKCGLYLKENGTHIEGIFRISGSTKRMKELQAIFDDPPFYGKDLDWKSNPNHSPDQHDTLESDLKPYFTIHDAANVLRRYLMCLPEPLISQSMYEDLKDVLKKFEADKPKQIKLFKSLLSTSIKPSTQYLLLYLLDLLSVFANRSDQNLMTANNLAVVFQPALCPANPTTTDKLNKIIYGGNHNSRHHQQATPTLTPHVDPSSNEPQSTNIQQESLAEQESIMKEVKQAQAVLEFLIIHQNHFVIGLRPQSKPLPNPTSRLSLQLAENEKNNLKDRSNQQQQWLSEESEPEAGSKQAALLTATPRPTSQRAKYPDQQGEEEEEEECSTLIEFRRQSDIKRSHTLPNNRNSPKPNHHIKNWNQILANSVGTPVPESDLSHPPPKYVAPPLLTNNHSPLHH